MMNIRFGTDGDYTSHVDSSGGYDWWYFDVKQQDFYFVRIGNSDYNYSNNPTYVTGSGTGLLDNSKFSNEPVTYITSIGLYDRAGGYLLAVAKLSKPLQKSFNSELSITVKLEY